MCSIENQSKANIEDDGVLLDMHLATISFLPMITKVGIFFSKQNKSHFIKKIPANTS